MHLLLQYITNSLVTFEKTQGAVESPKGEAIINVILPYLVETRPKMTAPWKYNLSPMQLNYSENLPRYESIGSTIGPKFFVAAPPAAPIS